MSGSREVLFTFQDCTATPLHPEDTATLQRLLEDCADYFELVNGCPPADRAAQELFEDKPTTKTLADKFILGLWESAGKLVGVLDTM